MSAELSAPMIRRSGCSSSIGQKRPVTVYRLVTANTIEEKIVRLHQEKFDLANSLLEGADVSTRISAEQLLELIRSA